MLARRSLLLLAALCTLLMATSVAVAGPRGLRAYFADHPIRIDGMPREWAGSWHALTYAMGGSQPEPADLRAEVMLAHDTLNLYLAVRVGDDRLIDQGDRVELVLGIPGGRTHRLFLYPGVVGKSAATAKTVRGRKVRGVRIVEAPTDAGYNLEAQIPWAAIPGLSKVRVGFRGAVFVHDADRSRKVESQIGTTDSRRYASLPPLSTEPELALGSGLLRERGLTAPPRYNQLADVVGDALQERVLVYERYLIVLGPGYRGGREYFFRDLGVNADRGELPRFKLRDVTGDGKADILLRRRLSVGDAMVTVFDVLSYHGAGEEPKRVFSHEIALKKSGGTVRNAVSLVGSGQRRGIVIKTGSARGLSRNSGLTAGSRTGASALLLPWGSVSARHYAWQPGGFVLEQEKRRRGASVRSKPPKLRNRAVPPSNRRRSTRPPSSKRSGKVLRYQGVKRSSDVARVYSQYRRRQKVSGPPRFDLRGDLAGDRRAERLVVHGLDLVAFGSGFRGGRAYAAVTLPGLEDPRALKRVKLQDVTGDGKQEAVVTAWMQVRLPEDVGPGHMVRSVIMIFKLQRGHWKRIFAAELARRIGRRRVEAQIALGAGQIVLRPGRAIGYQQRSYPWRQRTEADDGFEPLLLPWGGIARVRLRFDGERFVRNN